ncbi:allantoinase PuuE [Amylibacter sp.]|nr:allantoinase PuuE [Amylibacter sp.]MDA9314098.1 allantoinase PuuE [Amylibacter sp.]MDB2321116.1 allantoinase PuuE [Amylibacter sp.]MDB9806545.1 allantoinase PuuE [Amylibacter sp.]MDB9851033.1 allantoinase PuuE [Amylibacter sp.]
MKRYPRDMYGYGSKPPKAKWPNSAKIALQIVINFEEGGENNILHGDTSSEAFLSEIVGANAWPNQRHANMESIYEYGSRVGFWRLYDLFKNIPITVYGVASALARSPNHVHAMKSANWEIASHGLKWIDYKDYKEKDELSDMAEAIRLHTEVTGVPPKGWYTGRSSENTIRLAAETGNFKYIADSYADDLPYWEEFGDHDQLIVPYTLDVNDMRFATPQGFNSGTQFLDYLKDSFTTLYMEGCNGSPKMMSIGLHCRLIGRPGRFEAIRKFLEFVNTHADVWIATREQIADHWMQTHPHKRFNRPSKMNRENFIDLYGGIFEHSAWIADNAYDYELSYAHDTATGLHNALCRAFRSAPKELKLKVLRAHPDLAGKLAQAKRLTSESTSEQASAGMDSLTDNERKIFTQLNLTYVKKHGFPFIIAVRDHNKESILSAFKTRINNDGDTEFLEACKQVERIAEFRLMDILP